MTVVVVVVVVAEERALDGVLALVDAQHLSPHSTLTAGPGLEVVRFSQEDRVTGAALGVTMLARQAGGASSYAVRDRALEALAEW
jgi:hypothetical protein